MWFCEWMLMFSAYNIYKKHFKKQKKKKREEKSRWTEWRGCNRSEVVGSCSWRMADDTRNEIGKKRWEYDERCKSSNRHLRWQGRRKEKGGSTLRASLSGTFLEILRGLLTLHWRGTLYLRAAVQRCGQCPPKGLGTNRTGSNLAPKHARKHETHSTLVKKRSFVSIQMILVLFELA